MRILLILATLSFSLTSFAAPTCRYLKGADRYELKKRSCLALGQFLNRPSLVKSCLDKATFNLCENLPGTDLEVDYLYDEHGLPFLCNITIAPNDTFTKIDCNGNY